MPRNQAKELALRHRRKQVAALYLRGQSQRDIAQQLGVHQAQVSRDLKVLHQEWRASALQDFDARKARELAKIDELEREAWQAWKRSQEPLEITKASSDGSSKKVEKTQKEQCGDPRFLQIVDHCIRRRCDILGFQAPQRPEVSGPGGQPIQTHATVTFYIPENGRDHANSPPTRPADTISGQPG